MKSSWFELFVLDLSRLGTLQVGRSDALRLEGRRLQSRCSLLEGLNVSRAGRLAQGGAVEDPAAQPDAILSTPRAANGMPGPASDVTF